MVWIRRRGSLTCSRASMTTTSTGSISCCPGIGRPSLPDWQHDESGQAECRIRQLQRDRHRSHRAAAHRSLDLASGRGPDLDHAQGPARHHPSRHGVVRLPPLGIHNRHARSGGWASLVASVNGGHYEYQQAYCSSVRGIASVPRERSYLRFPRCCVFRKRTPGPPSFSLRNSTPALSKAEIIFFPVSLRPPSGPSCASNRLIVGIETSAAAARSSWDQARRARAALICLIDTFSIDFSVIVSDTFSIDSSSGCRRIIHVSSFFEVRHQT